MDQSDQLHLEALCDIRAVKGGQTKYLAGLFCDRSGFLISIGSVPSCYSSFELFNTVFLSVVSSCSLAERQDVQGHHGVFFCFGSSLVVSLSYQTIVFDVGTELLEIKFRV